MDRRRVRTYSTMPRMTIFSAHICYPASPDLRPKHTGTCCSRTSSNLPRRHIDIFQCSPAVASKREIAALARTKPRARNASCSKAQIFALVGVYHLSGLALVLPVFAMCVVRAMATPQPGVTACTRRHEIETIMAALNQNCCHPLRTVSRQVAGLARTTDDASNDRSHCVA